MDYFPAFLRLDDKACLLVGGGDVALRKARKLLAAGARVTVVAPVVAAAIDEMLESGARLSVFRRRFRDSDLRGQWLVVSATGDAEVERQVAAAAERQRVFCNAVDDLDNCSYITPAIVDRSPLVVAVSTSGQAPVLARRVRERIEATLPKKLGNLASLAGRWRQRVHTGLDSFRQRLRFWEQFVDGPVGREVLAGDIASAEANAAALLTEIRENSVTDNHGEAWLVGAGPGDPDLLTLAALRALQNADVVLYDRLVSEDVLALARRDAKIISVGKKPGCIVNRQQDINELFVQLVEQGNRVVRLKGGDPFIFGRGGEEAQALEARGLKYRVVPGITAAAGCAAAAGIPLTHRDAAQSVVLVTAHGKNSVDNLDWASLARDRQTLAVYMAVRRFPELTQNLVAHGRSTDTPIAIIERGTTPQQRVIRGRLGQLTMLARAHKIQAPAMLIVGEVAALGSGVSAASVRTPSAIDALLLSESAIQIEATENHG